MLILIKNNEFLKLIEDASEVKNELNVEIMRSQSIDAIWRGRKMEVLLLLLVMFLFSITGLFILGYTYSFVMKKLFHR